MDGVLKSRKGGLGEVVILSTQDPPYLPALMQTPVFSPCPFYGSSPLGPSEDKGLRTHTGPKEEELPVWKTAGGGGNLRPTQVSRD